MCITFHRVTPQSLANHRQLRGILAAARQWRAAPPASARQVSPAKGRLPFRRMSRPAPCGARSPVANPEAAPPALGHCTPSVMSTVHTQTAAPAARAAGVGRWVGALAGASGGADVRAFPALTVRPSSQGGGDTTDCVRASRACSRRAPLATRCSVASGGGARSSASACFSSASAARCSFEHSTNSAGVFSVSARRRSAAASARSTAARSCASAAGAHARACHGAPRHSVPERRRRTLPRAFHAPAAQATTPATQATQPPQPPSP